MPQGNVKVSCALNGRFCAKCCFDTKMPLTAEDISRISSLGYPEWYFVVFDEVPRLRNENGKCVFLNEDGSCSIYDHRPLGCKLYPLVYDPDKGAVLDELCPMRDTAYYDETDVEELMNLIKEIYGERSLRW